MKKLLVILGPTGTGKTDLALEIAKKFDGELVSADSRQIYTGMDIGTGKLPSSGEVEKHKNYWLVEGIPTHLYDLITPDKTFSVAAYQQLAYAAIDGIHKKNKLPILVGGTGLYIRVVVEGLKIPKVPPDKKLRERLEAKSLPALVAELENVDPEGAAGIDRENSRRIIRALEVYYQTGEPLSKLKGKFKVNLDSLKIGLTSNRDYLYNRADSRIEAWIKTGFIQEVRRLIDKGHKDSIALTSLGYRQIAMYLQGKISLQEAVQRIKFEHHSYIRAQLTWFRKEPRMIWFDVAEKDYTNRVYNQVGDWLK
ncbi:MAG TPA: tRNA (adenosine(37)-N6)-dimethylallyltransferase MiaA [Candidatus Nanoarchaeia archaeon]